MARPGSGCGRWGSGAGPRAGRAGRATPVSKPGNSTARKRGANVTGCDPMQSPSAARPGPQRHQRKASAHSRVSTPAQRRGKSNQSSARARQLTQNAALCRPRRPVSDRLPRPQPSQRQPGARQPDQRHRVHARLLRFAQQERQEGRAQRRAEADPPPADAAAQRVPSAARAARRTRATGTGPRTRSRRAVLPAGPVNASQPCSR